jgi:hypothetical protein
MLLLGAKGKWPTGTAFFKVLLVQAAPKLDDLQVDANSMAALLGTLLLPVKGYFVIILNAPKQSRGIVVIVAGLG